MTDKQTRYQQLEHTMSILVVVNLAFFLVYLVCALADLAVVKYIAAGLSLLDSCFGMWLMINTKEFKRPRSRWIVYALICIPLCILVSIICRFP